MDLKLALVVAKGKIDVSSCEKREYESENSQSMIKDLGNFILERYTINTEKDFKIVFFPVRLNNIVNLSRKQNKSLFGEPLVSTLFSIDYDKNREFRSFKKGESKIPSRMHYMIFV